MSKRVRKMARTKLALEGTFAAALALSCIFTILSLVVERSSTMGPLFWGSIVFGGIAMGAAFVGVAKSGKASKLGVKRLPSLTDHLDRMMGVHRD